MKKIFLLTLCVLLFACTTEQVTQSVDLDRNKLEMVVGDVVELRATVNPKDATNQNVEWDSSDLTVVAVRDGEVKAIGPGRAIVTVKTEDGGYTSECVVYVSPDVQTQKKGPMTLSLRFVSATTAVLSGFIDVDQLAGYDVSGGGVGFIYATSEAELNIDKAEKVAISSVDSENAFSKTLTGLKYDTRYVYTIFLRKNGIVQYGETQYFDTKEVTISVDQVSVTNTKATLTGKVVRLPEDSDVKVGLMYSTSKTFSSGSKSFTITPNSDGSYTQEITGLTVGTTYYYRTYLYYGGKYDYGEIKDFSTENIQVTLSSKSSDITATTAKITGTITGLSDVDNSEIDAIGVAYSTSLSNLKIDNSTKVSAPSISSNTFTITLEPLTNNCKYYYCYYVKQDGKYTYGDTMELTTQNVTPSVSLVESSLTATTAKIKGTVPSLSSYDKSRLEFGVAYSTSSSSLKYISSTKKSATLSSTGTFNVSLEGLNAGIKYYYCSYVKQNGSYTWGEAREFTTLDPYNISSDLNVDSATDLSSPVSANCYIVSNSGLYKFKTVIGNSSTSVGEVAFAAILWETFGTSTTPEMLDLIKAFCYKDGYIVFQTADAFKEGNAVIAAKDAYGEILWSWHIWLTDQPEEQEYYRGYGPMMDRNLGATSATPGDVSALGLLYQWGRKDPFLGSSSISSSSVAKSTITWPSVQVGPSSSSSIAYAIAHPTTFLKGSTEHDDWNFTYSDYSNDHTRWTTSESAKSIYDPCPSGWRVPNGGSNGVWSLFGSSSSFTYWSSAEGMNFSGKFGSAPTIWYPASGRLTSSGGGLYYVGDYGFYWSASPCTLRSYIMFISSGGYVYPSSDGGRADGYSVRCVKE